MTRLRNTLTTTLAAVALVAVYAVTQYHQDNVEQRAELQAFKARGCPDSWRGKPFAFSAEDRVNLTRPGTVSLACYYRKGVNT